MPDQSLTPEEFGAGLEAPIQTIAQLQPAGVVDPLVADLRSRLPGLPEDVTWDRFTDHVIDLETRAEASTAYQAKIAELEARLAASAHQHVQSNLPQQPQTPAQAKAVREWEAMQVDPQITSYVKPDPTGPGYIPLNPTNMAHIAAAEQMNQKVARDNRFSRAFVDDPYKTTAELMREQLEARDAAWEAKFGDFQKQFTPIQEQIASSKAERDIADWSVKHSAVLFTAEGGLTPLGTLIDEFVRDGIKPDDALAKATALQQKLFPQSVQPAAAKPQPISISKAQQPKPNFADGVRDRMSNQGQVPAERTPYQSPTNKRPRMDDILTSLGVSADDN